MHLQRPVDSHSIDRRRLGAATAALVALAVLGCDPDAPPEEGVAGTQTVEVTDADNCRFEVDLTVEVQPLRAGVDCQFSWASLSHDVHGHPLDPETDVESAVLVAFRDLSYEEVATGLVMDTLSQSSVSLFANCTPQGAGCSLSSFGLAGNTWHLEQYFLEGSEKWLLFLQGEISPGGLAFLFVEPRTDGTVDVAEISDDSSAVTIDAHLDEVPAVQIPAAADVQVSWESLKHDGKGNDLDLYRLDLMTVSRYQGKTIEELQAHFVDLEKLADETWEMDIDGTTSALLTDLRREGSSGDDSFPGFTGEGIWLLALRCTSCTNPTPKFLTILEILPGDLE